MPPEEPGRGLTEWKPLSLWTNLALAPTSDGLADRLPSEDDDEEAGRVDELLVPTIESIEKPILGLEEAGDVTGGEDLLLLDFVSSILWPLKGIRWLTKSGDG